MAVGGKQFFSLLLQNVWLVSCTLVFAEVLSLWSTAYPVHLCFTGFFLYNSLLHRAFQQGSFGEDLERVSYSFPLPSPAGSWHGPLHLPAGYNRGCVFLQTPGSERGCSLPFTLLSVAFPVSVYERLLQMKNSLVLS